MNFIKTLDEHIHAITQEFERSCYSSNIAVSDHINNVYCGLEDETAIGAVTALMDECDEIVTAAKLMKKRLEAYGKDPS